MKIDHCIQEQTLLSSLAKLVIIFFPSEKNLSNTLLSLLKITWKQFQGGHLRL